MFFNKKTFIVLLVVILAVSFFSVKTTRVHAADIWYQIYQWVILPLLRIVAQKLDNALLNKIGVTTSGVLGGGPHFITNWRNNILTSQARGNDLFRSELAAANLCSYFNDSLQIALGADKYKGLLAGTTVRNSVGKVVYQNLTTVPGMRSFQQAAKCTFPSSFNSDTFRNNFAQGGGWAAWDQLIQPQNNFFGAYALALIEQQKQIALENQANTNQNIANQGYLPNKVGTNTAKGGTAVTAGTFDYGACTDQCTNTYNTCVTRPTANATVAEENRAVCSSDLKDCDASCLDQQKAASQRNASANPTASVEGCTQTLPGSSRCISEGKTVTPGNIYNQASGARISKQTTKLQDAQSIGDIIQWLADDVTSKLTGQIDNMLGQDLFGNIVGNGQYTGTDATGQINKLQGQVNQSGQAGNSATCQASCTNTYNTCVTRPTANATVAEENRAVCSSDLKDCDANCP